jgi:murein DD-endopeptidase MepM/ murein hydrolase activator NlpD
MQACASPPTPRPRRRAARSAAAVLLLAALGALELPGAAALAVRQPPGGALSESSDSRWGWPLDPQPSVASPFDPPDSAWGAGNRGIDLFGSVGQRVLAIGAGEVAFAGAVAGRGVVVVRHGSLRSTYEPVAATVMVGEQVTAGQPVGLLEAIGSHCPPAVCLHLGVLRGTTYLDPVSLLGLPAIRLKPIGGAASPVGAAAGSASAAAVDAAVAAASHGWPTVR